MNVKIRNKFIEIKYSVSNGLVIFIKLSSTKKSVRNEISHRNFKIVSLTFSSHIIIMTPYIMFMY